MSSMASILRRNLRALVSGPAELQRALGGGVAYWSNLLRDESKSFGEKAARRIESGMGWPDNCLDELAARSSAWSALAWMQPKPPKR